MKRAITILTVLGAATLFGCDKPADTNTSKTEPSTGPIATSTATMALANNPAATPAATPTPAPTAAAEDELPTPAEFEDEAESAITNANYKTELASLETEVGKE